MTRRAWPRPRELAPRPSRPRCCGQPRRLPCALPLLAGIPVVSDGLRCRSHLLAEGRLQPNLALLLDRQDAASLDGSTPIAAAVLWATAGATTGANTCSSPATDAVNFTDAVPVAPPNLSHHPSTRTRPPRTPCSCWFERWRRPRSDRSVYQTLPRTLRLAWPRRPARPPPPPLSITAACPPRAVAPDWPFSRAVSVDAQALLCF